MGRFLIVRHGETSWNVEGRIQGHSDVALSERGVLQAQALARRLATVSVDAAYSSDLVRASETAKIVLEGRETPLTEEELLRERYYGVFEGLTVEQRQERYPAMFIASIVKDLDFAPTGGESARETLRRMTSVMGELKRKHLDDTVLVVGHGGSLRSGVMALLELPPESTWKFVMANCSLTIIDTYEDNAVLRLYNDTSHLAAVPLPAAGEANAVTGHAR